MAAAGRNTKQDIYVTTFFDENVQDEDGQAFVTGFQQSVDALESRLKHNGGNTMVSAASAMGYDAYFTVLEATKNAKSAEPEAIREALRMAMLPATSHLSRKLTRTSVPGSSLPFRPLADRFLNL